MSISCPHWRRPRVWSWTIAPLALLLAASAFAQDVQVFTDSSHPVQTGRGVPVLLLDAPARIEAALSAGLPADPSQAAAVMRQRLTSGGTALQRQLGQAYQGVAQAWGLGITKLPAVVVDGRYVVYGEPDVDRALARIAAYREAQP